MPQPQLLYHQRTREDVEQPFDIYNVEEDFGTTAMHETSTLETYLFLNHASIMMAYMVYERLRNHDALSKYAVEKDAVEPSVGFSCHESQWEMGTETNTEGFASRD